MLVASLEGKTPIRSITSTFDLVAWLSQSLGPLFFTRNEEETWTWLTVWCVHSGPKERNAFVNRREIIKNFCFSCSEKTFEGKILGHNVVFVVIRMGT